MTKNTTPLVWEFYNKIDNEYLNTETSFETRSCPWSCRKQFTNKRIGYFTKSQLFL